MRMTRIWHLAALVALIAVGGLIPTRSAVAQGPNLLRNPGFEGGYFNQDGIPEIAVPNGWRMWYLDTESFPGSEGPALRPETVVWFKGDAPVWEQDVLFRDGNYSLKIFKGGAPVYAGMSQELQLQRGARYRFTVPIFVDLVAAYTIDGKVAPGETNVGGVRLGVSGEGATWRNAGQINYGNWFTAANTPNFYLNMLDYSFEFTAPADRVTVWFEMYSTKALPNNGFFVDGLSLIRLAPPPSPTPPPTPIPPTPVPPTATPVEPTAVPGPTVTPLPTGPWFTPTPQPQPQPTATPVPVVAVVQGPSAPPVSLALPPTSTPNAEGVIYSVVGPGDSLWSVAAKAGITLDQILEYNDLPKNQAIFVNVGDLLIVGYATQPTPATTAETAATPAPPGATAAETPAAATTGGGESAAAPSATAQPTAEPPTPTPPPPAAELCLKAFDDANQNGLYEAGEGLRAGVAFTIISNETVVSNYVSDGQTETFCISNLRPGPYRITRSKLDNEQLTTGNEMVIALTEGASAEIAFGSVLQTAPPASENVTPAETAVAAVEPTTQAPATAAADTTGSGRTSMGILIAAVGAAVLLLIAALVIIFSRRSAD